jgi:hypothetical protein
MRRFSCHYSSSSSPCWATRGHKPDPALWQHHCIPENTRLTVSLFKAKEEPKELSRVRNSLSISTVPAYEGRHCGDCKKVKYVFKMCF